MDFLHAPHGWWRHGRWRRCPQRRQVESQDVREGRRPRHHVQRRGRANSLYQKYLLIFQPHTYTRTISLWGDFLQVLAKVPNLVLYKTYAARGKPIVGGRALDLSRTLSVPYFTNTRQLLSYLHKNSSNYDAIVLCGAGDVVNGEFLRQAPFVTFD